MILGNPCIKKKDWMQPRPFLLFLCRNQRFPCGHPWLPLRGSCSICLPTWLKGCFRRGRTPVKRKTAEAAKGRPYGGEELPMDRRGDLRSPLPRSPRRGDLRSPLQSLLLEEKSALPLPVTEEGSTLFPQRSENTRISVNPKCFSGTARREWHPPIPREADAG